MALKFRRGNNAQKSGSLAFGEPYVNTTLGTLQVGLETGDVTLQVAGTASIGQFGHISGSSLEIGGNATIGGNLTLGGNITIGDQTTDTVVVSANLSSSLIPSDNNTFDLGSSTKKYRDVFVGRNITIDGNTTLGNSSDDTISFSGSVKSNILPWTSSFIDDGAPQFDLGSRFQPWRHIYVSTGSIYFIGANGTTVSTWQGGQSGLILDNNLIFGGNLIGSGSLSSLFLRGNITATGSISASSFVGLGNLTQYSTSVDSRLQSLVAETTALEVFTASANSRLNNLELDSASQDSRLDNVEAFTSSINTTIKNKLNADAVLSGSAQITAGLPTNVVSASTDTSTIDITITAGTISAVAIGGIVSGSSQVSYPNLSNIPSGIVSGAAQVTPLLPAGTVSGSSQVSYTGLSNIPVGIVSGAAQVTPLLPTGTISGSSQVNGTQITNNSITIAGTATALGGTITLPTITGGSGIISGSGQLTATLPANVVSASSDTATIDMTITGGTISAVAIGGIVSGSSQVTSLLPTNVVSASSDTTNVDITITAGVISADLKGGVVSGSSQIDATATTNWATGIKTQLDSNTVVSGSAQIVGILSSLNSYTQSNDTTNTNQNNRLDSLESYSSSLKTAITVAGANVTVNGNLTVAGTTTSINSTTIQLGDNIIELNGTGVANGGLKVKDPTAPNTVSGSLLWDSTNDYWKAGPEGNESKILLAGGDGVISGSGQLAAVLPANVVSASTDTANVDITISSGVISADLKGGVVSGSAQVTSLLPAGTVSGSSQVDATQTTNWATGIKTQLNSNTVVSGSSQVSYIGLSNIPTGIVSGAAQVTSLLPTGTVSGSTQINGTQITNNTITIAGTSTALGSAITLSTITGGSGIISGSGQLTATLPADVVSASSDTATIDITINAGTISAVAIGGIVSGSSQVSYTGLTGIPSGIVSGAAQVTPLLPTGTISGSSQVTGITNAQLQNSAITIAGTATALGSSIALATITGGSGIISGSGQLTATLPAGVVSGSSQITYSGISGIPVGIVSGAAQVTPLLPTGTISGSSQVDHDATTNFVANEHIDHTAVSISAGNGLSGGGTIAATRTLSLDTTSATFKDGVKTKLNEEGVVSGSSQINGTQIQNNTITIAGTSTALGGTITLPTITGGSGIISGAAQLTTTLPAGVVSSSAQVVNYNLFALTASANTFYGNQTVSGSLYVTQDLVVLGSSSIQNVSSSTLNIGTNLITVAVNQPSVRFGGLAVIDSGSSGGSGSFLYDSVQDEFIFVHRGDGTNITSSHFLLGPETYNNLGNENYLTNNRVPKGTGKEHLNDSNITDTGTLITLGSNAVVNGTFYATGTTLVSGSAQISGTGITNNTITIAGTSTALGGAITLATITGGSSIISSSAQVTSLLPVGVVSGSSQLTSSFDTRYETRGNNIISSSTQITALGIISVATSGSTIYSTNPAVGTEFPTLNSIIFGSGSGKRTNSLFNTDNVYIGNSAGHLNNSNGRNTFVGARAGWNSDSASFATFVGIEAGSTAINANNATFIGRLAGGDAYYAEDAVHIGYLAGGVAWYSSGSVIIGANAGQNSFNSAYSTIIGYKAGNNTALDIANSMGPNNIIIGTNIGVSPDKRNSINIGGIIFGTGSYSTITGNTFSGSAGGRIGINVVNPNYNFEVSGTVALPSLQNTAQSNLVGYDSATGQLYYQSSAQSLPANVVSASQDTATIDITINSGTISAVAIGGIVSGSSQVSYTGLSNIPSGIVSGAAQVRPLLPAGTISGSSQVNGTQITNNTITIAGNSTALGGSITLATITGGSGIVSGSSQLLSILPQGVVSASSDTATIDMTITAGTISAVARGGIVSGSSQVTGITNAQLVNSAITIAGTSVSLGGSITLATITGGSGIISGSSQQSIATSGPTAGAYSLYSTTPAAGTNISNNNNIYFGSGSGNNTSTTSYSNFIGVNAGNGASNLGSGNNFIGWNAGMNATNVSNGHFIGTNAGYQATNSSGSQFIGGGAGQNATNAAFSNFIGTYAGSGASRAFESNFLGHYTGQNAVSASYSTLIGYQVGLPASGNGIGTNNIIIGKNITLANDRQDSINLGGVIFATGSYNGGDMIYPFSGSANGKVGINVVNPTQALDVSGSMNIAGNIIPHISGAYDLGSQQKPWRDLYVSTGSIYFVGANGVIQQSLGFPNNFGLALEGNLVFGGSLYGSGSASSLFLRGDATITGSVSASSFTGLGNLTTYSTSVDSRLVNLVTETSNLELFTSSINTTIKTRLNAETVISGSSQVTGITNAQLQNSAITIAGTSVSLGGSITAATILGGTGVVSGSGQLPAGVVSGSSQITYSGISGIPAGIVSGAAQVTPLLPTGTVSGSSQVIGILSSLNSYTASNNTNISALQAETTALEAFTASANSRLNNLESTSASVNTSVTNLNSYTSSLRTAITVAGSDVTVNGNLTVSGTTTTINSTTVQIGDNIIQLNGTGATNAGIVVRDATAATTVSGSLLWDTTNDKWIAGPLGSEDDVVLRTLGQTLTNKTIAAGSNTITGLTNSNLSGTAGITNANLANSAITIAGTSVSLGGTITLATITGGSGIVSGSGQLPAGVVSGSSQVSYTGLSNIPAGIVSGAAQVTPLLPTGTVSGSGQVSITGTSGYDANRWVDHTAVSITAGSGLSGGGTIASTRTLTLDTASAHFLGGSRAAISVSDTTGASGIDLTYSSTTGVLSGVLANSAITIAGTSVSLGGSITAATILGGTGVVSGSGQVTYSSLTGIPAGIVSGAAQITPLLPTGTVSGSAQITHSSTTGYVANQHVDHSTVSISAGSGLTGGGDITATRTLSIANLGVTDAMLAGSISNAKLTNSSVTINGTSVALGASATIPNLVSGSSQISYTGLTGIPAGIISSSATVYSGVSGDITIASNGVATIAANSVALGTDTTGNYMSNVSAGNAGIVISHTQGEGSTATISLVGGVVSGSAQIDVSSTTGDIALGTRTSGNYVATITAGTGVSSTGATTGEGIAHTISIGQAVGTSDNVRFGSIGVGMAASGTSGRIDAANDIVAFSSSDIRFKENIKPIENAIDKIRKISGNTYDWKEENKEFHGYEGNDVGVIAQEIEAVLPQLVQTRESGYKAVKYDKLVALLIEGMKEQQIQIDNLKIELAECKKQKGL